MTVAGIAGGNFEFAGGVEGHGYRTVDMGRGTGAQDFATKLGAHAYTDSSTQNVAEELQKMGGAIAVVSTAPSGKAMSALIDGWDVNGKFMTVGDSKQPIEVTPIQLISDRRSLHGWSAGTSIESEDTLGFSATDRRSAHD